jgi:hypothetical protein
MSYNNGNTNALKWTPERVIDCLKRIEAEAKKDEVFYLGQALVNLHFSQRSWNYWKKKFLYDDEIMDQIDLIRGIFEVKTVIGAKNGELPAAVAIFMLKNNHQWTDRARDEQVYELTEQREPIVYELTNNRALIVPYPVQKAQDEKRK